MHFAKKLLLCTWAHVCSAGLSASFNYLGSLEPSHCSNLISVANDLISVQS